MVKLTVSDENIIEKDTVDVENVLNNFFYKDSCLDIFHGRIRKR